MAEGKKFGTFGGVFTPSILTILGVIMYLRMGWIVGNAGLVGTIGIIIVAHIISVSTGLSISSIATDKKVGAGGVYYVLSRSLGLPIGGALGITLFVATAFSIALYMVGFAEIFNEYCQIGYVENAKGIMVPADDMTNSYRLTGSIGLLALTILALISTSIAIKLQYFILTAIILSLVSIFLGEGETVTLALSEITSRSHLLVASNMSSSGGFVGYATIFAIFFPAVTGFTAGVAMSGDLKDPKKAIPGGTMGSIIVGLVVYLALGIFLHYAIDGTTLINDPKAIFNWALIGILVYAGVWGATLSSALGGILGGPRILQAMSIDKLTPRIFAKGTGASNEPRNALILTVIIAEAGILIGDLNVIAEVVSMFYLAAYGFINLSFFLESWASSDFNPTFRVKKWIGLVGFGATFLVMSQLNLIAMVAAFVIIGGIYFFLSRRQIALGTGDIWQSVWATIVKKGLKRMESGNDHKRNWKPNTLLFSTDDEYRSKMIEFSKAVSGQTGIITNFDLHENAEAKVLFPKSKEAVRDEELKKYGIFGRRLEVQNIFKGIESIACTFGFSGIEPNTTLMNWPGQTKDPVWFTDMTEKLIALDYNVLYLDYDPRWGFRKKEQIDLWWRGVGNNSELMLALAKFITASPDWSHASIRILLVNDTNVDFKVIENRIQVVVDEFRVRAEIKVINNEVDQKPIYDLMKVHSSEADLVFVGIPEIDDNERDQFVEQTNNLVSVIGTTLLVKASSQFDETDLKLEHIELKHEPRKVEQNELTDLIICEDMSFFGALKDLDTRLDELVTNLVQNNIQQVENYHHEIFAKVTKKMDDFLDKVDTFESHAEVDKHLQDVLKETRSIYTDALENQLPLVYENLEEGMQDYYQLKENLILNLPRKMPINTVRGVQGDLVSKKRKVNYRAAIQRIWYAKGVVNDNEALLQFGYQNLILLHQSKNILHNVIWKLLVNVSEEGVSKAVVDQCKTELDEALHKVDDEALNMAANFYKDLRNGERQGINKFSEVVVEKKYQQLLQEAYPPLPNKVFHAVRKNIASFPSYWYRNLILFTYHLEADVYLISFTVKAQNLVEKVKSYTQENYLEKIQRNIEELEKEMALLNEHADNNSTAKILGTTIRLTEELFFNPSFVINNIIEQTSKSVKQMPEEIELMTARSINSIREAQGQEIITEKIALQEITAYLVRTNFVDPLHERIQVFYDQLKRLTGQLINATLILQKAIDTYAVNEKIEVLKEALVNVKQDIEAAKIKFEAAAGGFDIELTEREETLRKELNINQIIEQVEKLRQYVKLQKRRNRLVTSFKKINQKAGRKLGSVIAYLVKKQRDLTASEFREKYTDLVSEQAVVADFVETIHPKADLPFYYQQLFRGSHYSESRTLENRKKEISQINAAIARIDQGKPGGIIILSNAGAGKTYLTSHVINNRRTSNVYKIVPPVSRNGTKEDFFKALQRTTGIDGNLHKIMTRMPKKSIVIIEDIEQWWLRSEGGEETLNEVTKIINKFGATHYFILTSNIHSFQLIGESTTIQNAIIQTVVLTPFSAAHIKDIIWSRHQTGSLRIALEGKSEQHISASKLNKYLGKYHTTSGGNIGLALNQWLHSIIDLDDNTVKIIAPTVKEFPVLENEHWKNLIFQLFIHRNLSRNELYRIYGENSKNWVNRILMALKNAGVVEQNERGEFLLSTDVRPYIENWLDEIGFIK